MGLTIKLAGFCNCCGSNPCASQCNTTPITASSLYLTISGVTHPPVDEPEIWPTSDYTCLNSLGEPDLGACLNYNTTYALDFQNGTYSGYKNWSGGSDITSGYGCIWEYRFPRRPNVGVGCTKFFIPRSSPFTGDFTDPLTDVAMGDRWEFIRLTVGGGYWQLFVADNTFLESGIGPQWDDSVLSRESSPSETECNFYTLGGPFSTVQRLPPRIGIPGQVVATKSKTSPPSIGPCPNASSLPETFNHPFGTVVTGKPPESAVMADFGDDYNHSMPVVACDWRNATFVVSDTAP